MVKPYYDDGKGIVIYHGDCRELLPQLPKVDLVVTSPPYNVGLKYLSHNDRMSKQEFRRFTSAWIKAIFDRCSEGARFYSVVSEKMLWWFRNPCQTSGFRYVQVMPWCKPNISSGGSRISGDWNNLTEWVLLFRKGKRTSMIVGSGTTFGWFMFASPQSNFNGENCKQHVAQFPIELPRHLISRSPGETVCDPFCGSGQTLRAAKDLGRRAIGIEIEERYCEIAARRLSQEVFNFSAT